MCRCGMVLSLACRSCRHHIQQYHHESSSPRYQRASSKAMHFRSTYCSSQVLTQHIHNKKKTGKAQRASMAQEELQESKLTKAGGRKPTHGCNYPMVGWPSVILTPMGPSLNLTREGTSRPSLRSALSLSLAAVRMAKIVSGQKGFFIYAGRGM